MMIEKVIEFLTILKVGIALAQLTKILTFFRSTQQLKETTSKL